MVTAKAHPAVMTIHPAFWPLDLLSRTLATTPSPRRTRSIVPIISPRNCATDMLIDCAFHFGNRAEPSSVEKEASNQFDGAKGGWCFQARSLRLGHDYPDTFGPRSVWGVAWHRSNALVIGHFYAR